MRTQYPIISSSEMLQVAADKLQTPDCRVLPVMEAGRLVGLFTVENLGEFVMVQSALGSPKEKTKSTDQPQSPPRDRAGLPRFIA
jgi:CBS domain-containing protein